MYNRREVIKKTRATFILGELYQAYLSSLMIYSAAKDDDKFHNALAEVLIQIGLICSSLKIKSPCSFPGDVKEANRTIKNFFLDVQQIANSIEQNFNKELGMVFLFSAFSSAGNQFHNMVNKKLASEQHESLINLGLEIGLTENDVKDYISSPAKNRDSIIEKICVAIAKNVHPRFFEKDKENRSKLVFRGLIRGIPWIGDGLDALIFGKK